MLTQPTIFPDVDVRQTAELAVPQTGAAIDLHTMGDCSESICLLIADQDRAAHSASI